MTQAVQTAQYGSSNVALAFKNRIINGAMVIDQRNAGASVTPTTSVYTLDRWQYNSNQASKVSVQRNAGSVTPPVGFRNYLGITVVSAYSIGANDYNQLLQPIEGFNTADLMWGTANAQTVTLSFWVRSSLTGTFGGSLRNQDLNRSYPFSYTISSANTWEQKSITIPGDTTGTWITDSGIGMYVTFSMGAGSTFSGTAGAWAATNFNSATGAVSVVGTNGATFYLTGVQLEEGTAATSFDYRPYGTEFDLCQRYYQASVQIFDFRLYSGGNPSVYILPITFSTTMRASPTATLVGFQNITGIGSCTISGNGLGVSGLCFRPVTNSTGDVEFYAGYTASAEL